jgi:hypothetical protein
MSHLILKAICDADECERLGSVSHSTNPRKYVTLEQMITSYDNMERMRDRIENEIFGNNHMLQRG